MKKLLIIGGTRFVGRTLIENLILLNKYDITLFNRGVTKSDLPDSIHRIYGDRTKVKDLKLISNQDWDCVIDISGYWAQPLEEQFKLQKGKIGRYIYISTSSHYQFTPDNPHLIKEDEGIVPCNQEERLNLDLKLYYNEKKAECERIIKAQKDLDYIILRPGLIIGKYDHTDRLYYWFHKVKTYKEFLVADQGLNKISYTDVRDLSSIIIDAINIENKFKTYNCSSYEASIFDFISLSQIKLNKKPILHSATAEFLSQHNVSMWSGLPLWLSKDFLLIDNSRLKNEFNIQLKSIEETVEELIDYYSHFKKWSNPNISVEPISREYELELIDKLTK